jgi:hypothetical protein
MPNYVNITTYTVAGAFNFPIDMLRYDQAWPRSEAETGSLYSAMKMPTHPRLRGIVEVELQCLGQPDQERWNSFMWKVVEIDGVRL